jgi:hypothetical protein
MSWNYRVIFQDDCYSIHEVYYDDAGNIEGWTERAIGISGETMKELKGDLKYYSSALRKPVLVYNKDKNCLAELKQEEI